jgi:hypothetical protein
LLLAGAAGAKETEVGVGVLADSFKELPGWILAVLTL